MYRKCMDKRSVIEIFDGDCKADKSDIKGG